MRPSSRGIIVVTLGLAVALLPVLVSARLWPAWAIFWGAIFVLFGIDALLAPGRREIRLVLDAPDTLHMGHDGEARLALAAPTFGPVETELKLDLSDNLVPQPLARGKLHRDGLELRVPLVALRRGVGEIEAAWIRVEGPLGLLQNEHRIPLGHAVSAVPNVKGVRGEALAFLGAKNLDAGLKIERFEGDGSEFDSLEEFHQGTDLRAIDWKASARHNQLMARHFRAERNHQVIFAIDTGRLMAEPLGKLPRLDHAIFAALTLGYVSARLGDRVGFFAFDERPRVTLDPRAGLAAFRALAKVSADLAYTSAESNYTLGLTNLMARLRRRSLVVVLTDFIDTISAELMIDNLGRLARRHLVVFVALRDPLLGELSRKEPRDLDDLNRAVVADSLVRERELVLLRLRRQGILCIDAPPDRVSGELIRRYLEIKRRELI